MERLFKLTNDIVSVVLVGNVTDAGKHLADNRDTRKNVFQEIVQQILLKIEIVLA